MNTVVRACGAFLLAMCVNPSILWAQKFYPDDPIQEDRDNLPIEKPGEIELSATYDVLENTFGHHPDGAIPRAMNVNTLGEVPNSSWFTNRIGVRDMSLEELARGLNVAGPPDRSGPLTITSAKQGGITPGFVTRDIEGRVYYVKFDPKPHLNLSTGVDVIGKQFFHAMGYNVPENHIIYVRPDEFVIDPKAEVTFPGGKRAPMDQAYLDFMLENAARRPGGQIRAVASFLMPGELLGPFRFIGTRGDDPNDIFSHQHRRELRGYRVFCAWLNHDDSRSINTMDTFIGEGDRGYVKHFLIDFGSILGSGSDQKRRVSAQNPRAGNEYFIEFEPALKTAYTFGIWERPWMKVKYPYPKYAEIGRIEAEFFEPDKWKSEYPNPAFERMLADDAFWAAKIVARFSDEAIRAIVHTGEYMDSEAERYLADVIIKRRDKVVAYYYRQLNPLDGFRVAGSNLEFRNLGEEEGLATAEDYQYEWFAFDNRAQQLNPLGEKAVTSKPAVPIPVTEADYLMVRIRTRCQDEPLWQKSVDVYLRSQSGRTVVGIEREI
jgi:hypothetical protein